MRSLGNVSVVHSALETFPFLFFAPGYLCNFRSSVWIGSVTFLRCCSSEVCEVRASAFDVSVHDSSSLSRGWLGSRL